MRMSEARLILIAFAALLAGLALAVPARAGEASYCVTCLEPAQVYACTVKTPKSDPGDKALRLYCTARIAAERRHGSCAAARDDAIKCKGLAKTYTYKGPDIPPALRSAIEKRVKKQQAKTSGAASQRPEGEPEKPDTIVDLTARTLKSTREGTIGGAIKNTGKAVGGVAIGTGRAVGNAAKGTGRVVGGAARSTGQAVGEALKSTGTAVGGALKGTGTAVGEAVQYTYNCAFLLFRNCSEKDQPDPEDRGEDREAPR